MTARRAPGSDSWSLCCDAPGCEARSRPSATFGLAVSRGPMEGWAVTVRTWDPSVIDLCPAHTSLAGEAAARVRHPSARRPGGVL